jgi:hypothetical protein
MYDKFQILAMRAHDSLCVCILANDDATDIELVNPTSPFPEDTSREFDARGLTFLGVMGIVDGLPQTALEIPLDHVRISALSAAFVKYCEDRLNGAFEPQGKADDVDWLMRLFALPDERPEV